MRSHAAQARPFVNGHHRIAPALRAFVSLLSVLFTLGLVATPALAQAVAADPEPRGRINVDDLRSRGRAGAREWISARAQEDDSGAPREKREYDAALVLAAALPSESAGDLVPAVLEEAEAILGEAEKRAENDAEAARMSANLGEAHLRFSGDLRAARRLFLKAAKRNRKDEVALQGLAKLEEREEIDLRKEIESELAAELQADLEKIKRSQPSRSRPIPTILEAGAQP